MNDNQESAEYHASGYAIDYASDRSCEVYEP